MTIELMRAAGAVRIDDPHVEAAMKVYDSLTATEQREFYRSVYRAVTAYRRKSDIDQLVMLAESIEEMVHLEADPAFQSERRNRVRTPGESGGWTDLEEEIRRLRE